MLAYSLELKNIRFLNSRHDLTHESRSLLEIVILMLVEECEKLVRKGLIKDYVEHEDALPYLRGRLLIDKQFLSGFGRLDYLECCYDERTADIDENRLIYIALSIATRHLSVSDLLIKTRRLQSLFGEICNISGVDLRTLRNSISYDRRNAHYREAHRLSNLLLDSLGISDMYDGTSSCYAFLFDMNRLFEVFVGKWLARVVAGSSYKLEEQRRFRAVIWDADIGGSYSTVIPDFLLTELETGNTYLVADAKYKLYDERRLGGGDIYQAFTYAYALTDDNGKNPPRALIIFPSSAKNGSSVKNLCIRKTSGIPGAEVKALGVSIQHMLEYLDIGFCLTTPAWKDLKLHDIFKISS
jgi:5-methylcytosine-specific restriction enzyme subunit McrC